MQGECRLKLAQHAPQRLPIPAIVAVCAIFLVYGSVTRVSELAAPSAVLFWLLQASLVGAVAAWLRPRFNWPTKNGKFFAAKTVLVTIIACSILSVPSVSLDIVFGVEELSPFIKAGDNERLSLAAFEISHEFALLLLPTSLLLTALNWQARSGIFVGANIDERVAESPERFQTIPAFWSKLRRRRHGRLLAIEAQQHYILVHTTAGNELILYRFMDALKELSDWEGAQIHRSFWVARAAIKDIRVEGRNSRVVLTSGVEVPISRGRREEALKRFRP
jgi:hypothetical protein